MAKKGIKFNKIIEQAQEGLQERINKITENYQIECEFRKHYGSSKRDLVRSQIS